MITPFARKIENMHISIWLCKDLFWVSDYKWCGVVMIFPTLLVALWFVWKMRKDISELAHNLAVCCWIIANSTWMIGEFFYHDTTRPLASQFFVLGLTIIFSHYMYALICMLMRNYNNKMA